MHYTTDQGYGPLPFDPFKAIVAPRPIGWISTLNADGVPNLGPYSFFSAISSRPNMIGFTSDTLKHSARNAMENGEFVFNLSTVDLLHEMNKSSEEVEDGVNEFDLAGLEAAPSKVVKPPRVAAAVAALECRTTFSQALLDLNGKETGGYQVIGQVVATYIDDRLIKDGRFDTAAARPLGRCGYRDYAAMESVFELLRPTDPGKVIR